MKGLKMNKMVTRRGTILPQKKSGIHKAQTFAVPHNAFSMMNTVGGETTNKSKFRAGLKHLDINSNITFANTKSPNGDTSKKGGKKDLTMTI
jgi:hypothetical protein